MSSPGVVMVRVDLAESTSTIGDHLDQLGLHSQNFCLSPACSWLARDILGNTERWEKGEDG